MDIFYRFAELNLTNNILHYRMKQWLLLIQIGLLCLVASAQTSGTLSIWFDQPTTSTDSTSLYDYNDREWENLSLPIGNGSLGANILGSVAIERITLNEKSLWRGGPNVSEDANYYWNVNKNSAHLLPEIRQAFLDGNEEKAAKLTRENFNGHAAYEEYNEKPFRFGSYTTMGEILIHTDINEKAIRHYKRKLSLDSAVATVEFEQAGTHYRRNYFASYPDSIIVCHFSADQPHKQNLQFSYLGNPAAEIETKVVNNNELLYIGTLNDNGMRFALRVRVITTGGTHTIAHDGTIRIQNANDVLLLLTADTDYILNSNPDFNNPKTYVGIDPVAHTAKIFSNIATRDYNHLLSRHLNDYQSLFGRVTINLNPNAPQTLEFPPHQELPTNERLQRYREGANDFDLEELYFQFGRYLLISSSRKGTLPANLQGIWAKGVDGPWRVDYHNNINLQMNYWPATSTQLLECNTPLVDYILSLVKPGEKTAQAYYNARGWTASISSNIFGFTAPLSSQDMSWNFSPMAGPWLALHLWEHFQYCQDVNYLKGEVYEAIKGSANFTADYLWQRPDGHYVASPSTSPEHGPIDAGATFAHAVAREILASAIAASKELRTDRKNRREWQRILQKIAPYQIGRYGQLMEWSQDIDDPNDQHRHVNHLFGLHPGSTVSPVTTPELAEASRVVLEHRGDGATGWSMGWKINQWARLHDGNRAYLLFGNLLKNGTLDNLWDTHPPFQIDGNFGGTAGIVEMLLQSHLSFIHLLPALPDAWQEGNIKGIMARGGFEVEISWTGKQLTQAIIHSHSGKDCHILYQNKNLSFPTEKGKSYLIEWSDNQLIIKTQQ